MNVAVIIPGAGSGSRFGGEIPKQFLPFSGKPLLQHVIERFILFDAARIVVAVADQLLPVVSQSSEDRVRFVAGGASRQESVTRALRAIETGFDVVAVHDAVRPLIRRRLFDAAVTAALEHGAALPAIPISDTIHTIGAGAILKTLDRSQIVAAQTPQCFRTEILVEILERAFHEGVDLTDEASLAALYGYKVAVVPGDPDNVKITRRGDFVVAEALLAQWSEE